MYMTLFCWPLSHHRVLRCGSQNPSWSDSWSLVDQLLLILRQEIEILQDVSLHVFSDGDTPSHEPLQKFPDKLFRIVAGYVFWLSVQSVCQRNRHRHVLVFEPEVFRRLQVFGSAQQRLEIVHDKQINRLCMLQISCQFFFSLLGFFESDQLFWIPLWTPIPMP